jgi:flagellar biosynthesis protein FlhF
MKVKKYTAPTFKEAVFMMKEELGDDAVVLSSKKIKSGGVLDLMGKEMIEVTAALETAELAESIRQRNTSIPSKKVHPRFKQYLDLEQKNDSIPQKKSTLDNSIAVTNQLKRTTEAINQESLKVKQLHSEISNMKEILGELSDNIKNQKLPALPKNLKSLLLQMVDQEIDEVLAKNLINILYANLNLKEIESFDTVRIKLLLMIQNLINTTEPLKNIHKSKPYVFAVVGPTGVGKTTTIAKIAANSKIYDKLKVAIITTDTYRIAAADQLETFASIAGIPFEIAYNQEDLKNYLNYFRNKDVIFIDTVGRSQNNSAQIQELKNLLELKDINNIQLVVSAQSSKKNMLSVIEKFSSIPYSGLIFSKLDEVTSFGNILNVQYDKKIPLSYVTTGQNVPDDIDTVNAEKLARLILDGIKE